MSPPIDLKSVGAVLPSPQVEAVSDAMATQSRDSRGKAAAPKTEKTSDVPAVKTPSTDDGQTSLGFSIDRTTHDIKIRVTNESSGQVVREFELRGLGDAHVDPRNKGLMVDDKT